VQDKLPTFGKYALFYQSVNQKRCAYTANPNKLIANIAIIIQILFVRYTGIVPGSH
jgi:hypothetical protein